MKIQKRAILEWSKGFEKENRIVAKDDVNGHHVSTVFLGLNHALTYGSKPHWFETMIFKNGEDVWMERCETYDEAEALHEKAKQWALHGDAQ